MRCSSTRARLRASSAWRRALSQAARSRSASSRSLSSALSWASVSAISRRRPASSAARWASMWPRSRPTPYRAGLVSIRSGVQVGADQQVFAHHLGDVEDPVRSVRAQEVEQAVLAGALLQQQRLAAPVQVLALLAQALQLRPPAPGARPWPRPAPAGTVGLAARRSAVRRPRSRRPFAWPRGSRPARGPAAGCVRGCCIHPCVPGYRPTGLPRRRAPCDATCEDALSRRGPLHRGR